MALCAWTFTTACNGADEAIGFADTGTGGVVSAPGGAGAPSGGVEPSAGGQDGAAGGDTRYVSLMPGDDGWLDTSENELGLQGPWYTFASTDSTISPTYAADQICAQGSGAQVLGDPPDWGTYYGAALATDLCQTGESGDPPDAAYALGSCPFAPDVLDGLVGIRFQISGTLPGDLRVAFREADRAESAYVSITKTGEVVALFADALVGYDPDAAPLDPTKIEAIQIQVATNTSGPSPFDFCISGLEAILGTAPDTSGVPAWVAEPGPGMQVELAGVNLSVAEFGEAVPGVYGTDYTYPTTDEVDYFVGKGMNVFRIPFLWERLQPELYGPLDPDELERLASITGAATAAGATVILDPHNYARYRDELIGSDAVPNDAFADFWARVATEFADDPRVAFGLVNEPNTLGTNGTENWLVSANAAIAAIRETGATNLVLVPGNQWTGAHSWTQSFYGTPNSMVMGGVVDPADHFAFELHQYLDSDSSGAGSECVSETIGVERVTAVTEWLRASGFRGFLGEFGGYSTPTCYRALDHLLAYVGENSDVWMGWAWWAAGPWWGDYGLSIEPRGTQDRPQMALLSRHLTAP